MLAPVDTQADEPTYADALRRLADFLDRNGDRSHETFGTHDPASAVALAFSFDRDWIATIDGDVPLRLRLAGVPERMAPSIDVSAVTIIRDWVQSHGFKLREEATASANGVLR